MRVTDADRFDYFFRCVCQEDGGGRGAESRQRIGFVGRNLLWPGQQTIRGETGSQLASKLLVIGHRYRSYVHIGVFADNKGKTLAILF